MSQRPALLKPKYDRQRARGLHTGSAEWRRIRAQVLAEQPLCSECMKHDRIAAAVDVDHVDGDSHNQSRENLTGLCRACHSTKTAREQNGSATVFGCDINGQPLDPDHPWNRHE